MATSLCFTRLISFNSPNKPGILIGASTSVPKVLRIDSALFRSSRIAKSHSIEVKAGDSNPTTKSTSIVCGNCDGNDREVRGCRRDIQSPFFGKIVSEKCFLKREIHRSSRGNVVVASMVGRKAQKRETVVPDPDYRIPVVLLGLSGGLAYTDNLLAAAPVGLLGLLLLFQTTRVRFVFDEEALEVKVGEQLQESGENVFVGGKNRWKYSTFVNWELWWPNFPILVYFKETQTKPEGQVHFFPVIFNGKQLYDVMVERAGPSKTSGPQQS